MTATYRVTGLRAAINSFPCLRKFQLTLKGHDTVAACSASNGGVLRTDGNKDWGGVAIGYGRPPAWPGDYFTFTGSDRNGQGWRSSTNGAIVDRVRIFCPIETGRHIYWQINFLANGPLVKGAYAAVDGAVPAPLNCKGLKFYVETNEVKGVLGWEFDLDGNTTDPSYPSHLAGWPARDPGNLDATLTWDQTFDEMSQLYEVGSSYAFSMYDSASTFYTFRYGQILDQPVEYQIEGNPPGKGVYITAVKQSAHFTGFRSSSQGTILVTPYSTAIWP